MAHNRPKLVTVIGPTASGKTDLAIRLAQHFSAEVFSADSRQFYKELNIGVARPSQVELAAVAHHFIGHISIEDHYSAGDFEKEAIPVLNQYFLNHQVGILVGGSGLFTKAITNGLDQFPEVPSSLREELNARLEAEGLEALVQDLKKLDPVAVELGNPRRVIRALEVSKASGKPFSSFKQQATKPRPFDIVKVALKWERDQLYDRINQRTELMFANGLLDEVKGLLAYKDLNALNTVGYTEVFKYLDGTWTREKALEKVQQHTRNYAKRQMTWLRKQEDILWVDTQDDLIEIVARISGK